MQGVMMVNEVEKEYYAEHCMPDIELWDRGVKEANALSIENIRYLKDELAYLMNCCLERRPCIITAGSGLMMHHDYVIYWGMTGGVSPYTPLALHLGGGDWAVNKSMQITSSVETDLITDAVIDIAINGLTANGAGACMHVVLPSTNRLRGKHEVDMRWGVDNPDCRTWASLSKNMDATKNRMKRHEAEWIAGKERAKELKRHLAYSEMLYILQTYKESGKRVPVHMVKDALHTHDRLCERAKEYTNILELVLAVGEEDASHSIQ
jgi:hypothetical protein